MLWVKVIPRLGRIQPVVEHSQCPIIGMFAAIRALKTIKELSYPLAGYVNPHNLMSKLEITPVELNRPGR
jgi:hypothetical protein